MEKVYECTVKGKGIEHMACENYGCMSYRQIREDVMRHFGHLDNLPIPCKVTKYDDYSYSVDELGNE